eukprot:6195778-Pleurochrysis_carterae.AAC.1
MSVATGCKHGRGALKILTAASGGQECYFEGLLSILVCSWLMVLDESMVRRMGRGVPGLMASPHPSDLSCTRCAAR